jgi:hypothetical protein
MTSRSNLDKFLDIAFPFMMGFILTSVILNLICHTKKGEDDNIRTIVKPEVREQIEAIKIPR